MCFRLSCGRYQTSAHDGKIENGAGRKLLATMDRGDYDAKEYVFTSIRAQLEKIYGNITVNTPHFHWFLCTL